MAYVLRYQMPFTSETGVNYWIDIYRDGPPAGVVDTRPLGASPVLHLDSGDVIRGTSLTISLECQVDGEFMEFYTCNPYEYKVELRCGTYQNIIWTGFISPELYSEPEQAVPYDVPITAVDGLGELKLTKFAPMGRGTLRTIMEGILHTIPTETTLSLASSLTAYYGNSTYDPTSILDRLTVNMDHMAGETMYDVLEAMARSLGCILTYGNNIEWLLISVSDSLAMIGQRNWGGLGLINMLTYYNRDDVFDRGVLPVGSVSEGVAWPIGTLSRRIVPAVKQVTITSPNHYPNIVPNGSMDKEEAWRGNYTYNDGCYTITGSGGSLYQDITPAFPLYAPGKLTIKMTAEGYPGVAKIRLRVRLSGMGATKYLHKGSNGSYTIDYPSGTTTPYVEIDLGQPIVGADEGTAKEYSFDLSPISNYPSLSFSNISINLSNASDTSVNIKIYEISLKAASEYEGYKRIVNIDNNAREVDDEVELTFAHVGDVNPQIAYLGGVLNAGATGNNYNITYSDSSTPLPDRLLRVVARSRALERGQLRWQYSGVIQMPNNYKWLYWLPLFLELPGGFALCDSFAWSLYNDELDFTATTLPSGDVVATLNNV